MRHRNFEVPEGFIVEFSKVMEEHELENIIRGVTDDGDIEISVDYEPDQKHVIHELLDAIDEYNDLQEEEDEEDTEEDEEEDEDE